MPSSVRQVSPFRSDRLDIVYWSPYSCDDGVVCTDQRKAEEDGNVWQGPAGHPAEESHKKEVLSAMCNSQYARGNDTTSLWMMMGMMMPM